MSLLIPYYSATPTVFNIKTGLLMLRAARGLTVNNSVRINNEEPET